MNRLVILPLLLFSFVSNAEQICSQSMEDGDFELNLDVTGGFEHFHQTPYQAEKEAIPKNTSTPEQVAAGLNNGTLGEMGLSNDASVVTRSILKHGTLADTSNQGRYRSAIDDNLFKWIQSTPPNVLNISLTGSSHTYRPFFRLSADERKSVRFLQSPMVYSQNNSLRAEDAKLSTSLSRFRKMNSGSSKDPRVVFSKKLALNIEATLELVRKKTDISLEYIFKRPALFAQYYRDQVNSVADLYPESRPSAKANTLVLMEMHFLSLSEALRLIQKLPSAQQLQKEGYQTVRILLEGLPNDLPLNLDEIGIVNSLGFLAVRAAFSGGRNPSDDLLLSIDGLTHFNSNGRPLTVSPSYWLLQQVAKQYQDSGIKVEVHGLDTNDSLGDPALYRAFRFIKKHGIKIDGTTHKLKKKSTPKKKKPKKNRKR